MARTYPAKRSRIATITDAFGPVTAIRRTCAQCSRGIEIGQRITESTEGAVVHARCADAAEALP